MELYLADIKDCDILNGSGLRVSVWFQGCEHHCEGCQNPQTWNPDGSSVKLDERLDEIRGYLSSPYIKGITLTGGDPFYMPRIEAMNEFVELIKKEYPSKDIWAYSGYTYEELLKHPVAKKILDKIDVLCDGKFEIAKRDVDTHWVGSTNQRVIDVKKSLEQGEVVLLNV